MLALQPGDGHRWPLLERRIDRLHRWALLLALGSPIAGLLIIASS